MLPRKQRVSVTKLQRQSAAGTELIALCQTITADGSLADDEVDLLRQWLEAHRGDTALPAQKFLITTVEQIVADGCVTDDERLELYRAIETVLPPDVRATVRQNRTAAEAAARVKRFEDLATHHELAAATKRAEAESLERLRVQTEPIESWDFMVAGVLHEGRARVVSEFAESDDAVFLVRDRANAFSKNAVEVRLRNGVQIGFVPEQDAREMAALLDARCPHRARITKILSGGRAPIPVVFASLYDTETTIADVVFEGDVPAKSAAPKARPEPPTARGFEQRKPLTPVAARRGCLTIVTAIVALGCLAILA